MTKDSAGRAGGEIVRRKDLELRLRFAKKQLKQRKNKLLKRHAGETYKPKAGGTQMTDDPMKLLAEVRSLFLAHVDLNTCYPHERRVITDIDRYLATGGWTEVTGFIPPENTRFVDDRTTHLC